RTNEGCITPLDMHNGLPHLKMVPNAKTEREELPHIVLTSGEPWDPRVLDNTLTDKDDWFSTLNEFDNALLPTPFDEYGNYRNRTPETATTEANATEAEKHDDEQDTVEPLVPNDGVSRLQVAYHRVANLTQLYAFPYERDQYEGHETHMVPRGEKKLELLSQDVKEDLQEPDTNPETVEVESSNERQVKKKPVDYAAY
ncbi:MAG: hypothetical protein GY822_28165, partial [Deltaproteobacteria bacterium]|nr:hypothetical protein [Deltaproteobacteria bacterium]